MNFFRVIPRDLFNDANLLKCCGQLALLHLDGKLPGFEIEHDGDAFDIQQLESSGATYVTNFGVRCAKGNPFLSRPLNARGCWPLYAETEDDEVIAVFDDDGHPTPEFLALAAPIGWDKIEAGETP